MRRPVRCGGPHQRGVRRKVQLVDAPADDRRPFNSFVLAGPNGERVDHYVESFDPESGLATVWVKGTNFDPAATSRYHLYYGGDAASTDGAAAGGDSLVGAGS